MKRFILNIWYTILFRFDQHRNKIPDWWFDNKNFDDLPNSLQRIRIARDVIAQLNVGKYRARSGSYISYLSTDAHSSEDVKENFDKIAFCRVCLLGACLLSITKFKNTLNFGHLRAAEEGWGTTFRDNALFRNLLLSVFDPVTMAYIEIAFEESNSCIIIGKNILKATTDYESEERAMKFGRKYTTDLARMEAIMQNIIDNRGEFKP